MRIIAGKYKGLRFSPPAGLPVRPTTDLAKEALFNVLQNRFEMSQIIAVDLFSGTGNISIELGSRAASSIIAVEKHPKCTAFLNEMKNKFELNQLRIVRDDVLKFLKKDSTEADFVFADPPYDMPELTLLPQLVLESGTLKAGGLFVLEHPTTRKLPDSIHLTDQRKYGYSSFSFFEKSHNIV